MQRGKLPAGIRRFLFLVREAPASLLQREYFSGISLDLNRFDFCRTAFRNLVTSPFSLGCNASPTRVNSPVFPAATGVAALG